MNLTSLVTSRFGSYKMSGDWINVNCPFPHFKFGAQIRDRTFKLGINVSTLAYNCFVCGARGGVKELLGVDVPVEVERALEKVLEPLPEYQKLTELKYPWNELVDEFLQRKSFTKEELCDKVFFVEDYRKGKFIYGPCLIFPIYQFNCYRGFQVRTIYNNTEPKYFGASGMDRRSILYNYDIAFSNSDRLVVTEGFFDCLRVGDTAIATLGKSIAPTQLRLIRLGNFKQVIVFLDKDADLKAMVVAQELAVYFDTYVARPKWEDLPLLPDGKEKKDPGDLTQDELNEVFEARLKRSY